jgi:hypothetical protein
MNLTGSLAILAGWLMLTPLRQSSGAIKYGKTIAGISVLTAGMFAVIQGRL